MSTNGDCAATGILFDPHGVRLKKIEPIKYDPATYAVGDLSGKYGQVKSGEGIVVIDPSLQLKGDAKMAIVGRSIVMKDAKGSIVACGNIVESGALLLLTL